MRSLVGFLCLGLLAALGGAQEQKPKEPITYRKHVEPILVRSCVVCHSGEVKEGKLDLSTYERLMKGGKSGPAVSPGKAEESILYHAVARTGSAAKRPRPMPPKRNAPLSPAEVAVIKQWINEGAKAPIRAR